MSRLWMICYDIADDRRRAAVAAALESRGRRVLESVFEVFLDTRELANLRRELALLVAATEDGLRFYPLCGDCQGSVSWQGAGTSSIDGHWFLI